MLRLWRHLHLLKRGGRAHDSTGASGTAPGELAVMCPACPYPTINLPDNWMSVAKELRLVSNVTFPLPLFHAYILPDISTISVLASMPASASNADRYPAMKKIPSWDPASHMSLHGNRIAGTSASVEIRVR